jgi:hypothetical protein
MHLRRHNICLIYFARVLFQRRYFLVGRRRFLPVRIERRASSVCVNSASPLWISKKAFSSALENLHANRILVLALSGNRSASLDFRIRLSIYFSNHIYYST